MVKNISDANTVEIAEHVNPSILGGIKVEFAGNQIDSTIVRRLNVFKITNKK